MGANVRTPQAYEDASVELSKTADAVTRTNAFKRRRDGNTYVNVHELSVESLNSGVGSELLEVGILSKREDKEIEGRIS